MDKFEYQIRTEKMLEYLDDKKYQKAMEIADTIDWKRVKNATMLNSVSEIYESCGELAKSRDILSMAYDKSPGSKKIVFRLALLALKVNDVQEASDYCDDFMKLAPRDPNRFILKYKVLKAQNASLEQQIAVLEDLKKAEYVEKWAYELAKLYHEAGRTADCLEECDDLILWFSEGKYVYQAMELKMRYSDLSPAQQQKYDNRKVAEEPRVMADSRRVGKKDRSNFKKPAEGAVLDRARKVREKVEKAPIHVVDNTPASNKSSFISNDSIKTTVTASTLEEALASGVLIASSRTKANQEQAMEAKVEEAKSSATDTVEEQVSNETNEEPKVESINDSVAGSPSPLPTMEAETKSEAVVGTAKIDEILKQWEAQQRINAELIAKKKSEAMQAQVDDEVVQAEPVYADTQSLISDTVQKLLNQEDGIEAEDESDEVDAIEEMEPVEETAEEHPENIGLLTENLKLNLDDEEADDDLEDYEEVDDADNFDEIDEFDDVDEDEFDEDEADEFEDDEFEDEADEFEDDEFDDEEADEFEDDEFDDEEADEFDDDEFDDVDEEGSEDMEMFDDAEDIDGDAEFDDAADEFDDDEDEEDFGEEADDSADELDDFDDLDSLENDENFAGFNDIEEDEEDAGVDMTPVQPSKSKRPMKKKRKRPAPVEEPLEIEEPSDEEIEKRLRRSKGGVSYDTGFVVQGRYDLSATSEIGIKAGLTEEQKKLFSYFVPVRGVSEQIVDVLEGDKRAKKRYGTSRTGNIVVIGRRGSGKTVLAVNLVKAIQKQRKLKQGKVAIVTGDALNKKELGGIIKQLNGGAIIIEKAGKLTSRTIREFDALLEEQTGEMLVILEDQRKSMERMFTANPNFKKKFTSKIELPVFVNDELVTFAQTYAKENGYRIDDMGILALYTRIDILQREDHAVTVAEVKDIMDAAISRAQTSSVKQVMKRVFGRNTDDANYVLLKEDAFRD